MRTAVLGFLFLAGALGVAVGGCSDGEESGGGGTGGGSGGTGGLGGTGGADGGKCPTVSFVKPTSGAKLTEADDADKDGCANGFQYAVDVLTAAADGTEVTLYANGSQVGSSTVSAGHAVFSSVQLDSKGTAALKAQVGSDSECTAEISVEVACAGAPTCSISKPLISATHPALNGVPVAQGGDRVSADGSPYQAAFEVATNVEDGQPVTLNVDGSAVGITVNASGGVAAFPGVTLTPDGDHKVQATCTPKSGIAGKSALGTFPVDSTNPDLTVSKPKDGEHIDAAQIEVCGTTTSTDATATSTSNFCAAIGTATPVCAPMTATGVCVQVPCPGGAPFDMNVTLTDTAGNPITKKLQQVSCASSKPLVQIITPVAGTGSDPTKHILAAGSPAGQPQDKDGTKSGAQYDVVACTSAPTGNAQLYVGLAGGALAKLGTAQALAAATPADNCPTGSGSVAKFVDVTLPESTEDKLGALEAATELRVDVTDVSLAVGQSPVVGVWVDSIKPSIQPFAPTPLCGQLQQSGTPYTTNFTLTSTTVPVNVTITNGANVQNLTGTVLAIGQVHFGPITFQVGNNSIVATGTEPSGNTGALTAPCTFKVGNPPTVTWINPTTSTQFNATTDGNSTTAGWQGSLQVQTSLAGVPGATVQFSTTPGGNLGSPVAVDATGKATITGATIPEGDPVQITAATNDTGTGVGQAVITAAVDVAAPSPVSGFAASIKSRRQTTFHLDWTAPADGGTKAVFGYDVRVSTAAINAGNFDSAEKVAFSGTPAAPGAADGIDIADRWIETDYYFAVAALDKAGNRSTIQATSSATKATFNKTTLTTGTTNQQFGYEIDGSSDLNGDGITDLLVGTGNDTHAYIYYGGSSWAPSAPDVVFTGSSVTFGLAANVVGDVNKDGHLDIAIGSLLANKVFVFAGSAGGWPATISESSATWTISADSSLAGALFGAKLARLGDFNGDGFDDFAVGAPKAASNVGNTTIILGSASFASLTVSATTPTAGTIVINGDAGYPSARLGTSLLGLGKYFGSGGNALVTTAPFASNGRGYAFLGQSGSGGVIPIASANQTADGAFSGSRFGMSPTSLGNLGGTGLAAVGLGAPAYDLVGGTAVVFLGAAGQPFGGTKVTFTNSKATSAADAFGLAVIGGGFSGTSVTTSFIGDAGPDLAISGLSEAGAAPTLYIYSGQQVAALAPATDVAATAQVKVALPSDWVGASMRSSAAKDVNGDGFGDIAVGEFRRTGNYNGRVFVLW